MARLSVIVTCLDDVERFENTLASVLQNRPASSEVLAVVPSHYGDPYGIANEIQLLTVPPPTSWVRMVNTALPKCQGQVVHVLDSGIEVQEGWADAALQGFEDPEVAAVAPWILDARSSQRIVTLGVRWGLGGRRREVGAGRRLDENRQQEPISGPSWLAGFYRRDILTTIGGFDESVGDQLADIDLALTLHRLGWRSVVQSDSRVLLHGEPVLLPAGFRWGRQQQHVFWRHFPGTGVASLLMLPLVAMCQSLANLPRPAAVTQPLGRLLACLEFWRYRRHHRRMTDLQLQSPGATASRLRLAAQDATSDPDPRPSKLPRAA